MVAPTNRKQDKFQAYYTNCDHITSYMVGLLECDYNMSVLEPCAGEGVFIDELLKQKLAPEITAYELNIDAVNQLNSKYNNLKNIEIIHQDFILIITNKKFDRVIANPPYGAYQSPEKRKQLKTAYPHIYAKETYGLFLIRTMELLKQQGRLVFIIPDTYLSLHHHQGLRKEIISNYKIESITLFPSDF
ncbi:MAG: Eco57I restriction-modification methylase domain-containing protein, partial [Planktothrix sp.]